MKLHRSLRILAAFSLFALFTGAWVLGAEAESEGPELVAGRVHYLIGSKGGNVGLQKGPDGVLVVDDKFADTTEEIERAIASLQSGRPTWLINTHHHGDHTGGNAHFGKSLTIVAHDNVRKRLEAEGGAATGLPVVTHADGASLHFNGEEVRLIHVPRAHTDGDTVVWFKGSKVIHLGDLYFQIGFPFLDVASGGSAQGLVAGLDRILELVPADTKVVPGHGVVTGVDGLREYRDMVATSLERVRELKAEGFSADDMLAAGVVEDYVERWTWGFIDAKKFVTSIVAGLDE